MAILLRLFVTGKTGNSAKAIDNLTVILNSEPSLKGKYKLEVIDILKHPQLAEDEKIIATPVLEKTLPAPIRRIIGDLSNKEKVLIGLDVINNTEEKESKKEEKNG
jgi:circadian clock protein KaiB